MPTDRPMWPVAELERVLWALAPDERPSVWAARSGQPETTVRLAISVVARARRTALGWSLVDAATAAGIARSAVVEIEWGYYRPTGIRWLWAAFAAEDERREQVAAQTERRVPVLGATANAGVTT